METEERQDLHSYIIYVWAVLLISNDFLIVTKTSILDDERFRDPPLVCLLSVQNITKNIKI